MNSIPRNVILDLLPAYISGEVSKESRDMVEQYAQNDTEIAGLIRAGALDSATSVPRPQLPDELEDETMKRIRRGIRRKMGYVALTTIAILMVPLVAMMFTSEVNWQPGDFVVMGGLLFAAGLMYVLMAEYLDDTAYRVAVGVAVGTGLLLVWVNLAVGIIGAEGSPANLLYAGVLGVGLVGAGVARCRPRGMAYTLLGMALAQFLVPLVAMLIWQDVLNELPGIPRILLLNALFAGLFALSGALFRRVGRKRD